MKKAPAPYTLVYRIDASNRITWVNEAWSEFARSNQGESVMPEHVLGQELFARGMDGTVEQLYASIIARVRAGNVVRFNYRCDAPEWRRVFAMEVRVLGSREVEFSSTLTHEEKRPSVGLLEQGGARSSGLLRVCSWCQNVATPEGHWLPVEEAVAALQLLEAEKLPAITHGICPSCLVEVMASLHVP